MKVNEVLDTVKVGTEIIKLLKEVIPEGAIEKISRMYGFIHKQTPAEINGVKGFLIWDYIFVNEITFKDMDGNIYSLFKCFKDNETEEKWNELVKKFGV